ncbi:olfactory receptor class A-like protein 4 isoform X2 [Paramormyrops kingsleyae]|uniref:olfactory receptor class A-like protein 4 isoform X2 n=1 Tax=Paramormyrops kingsleyae TaxID=1676925 RepID=UPI000CD5E39A|nr:neuropeptide F receptor-like [Paramormyrops kingsleyae]
MMTRAALYTIMVIFGILGNGLVIGVVGESVLRDSGRGASSDIILVNMALSNLLVSLVRNVPLMLADSGLQLYLSMEWCRLFMCVWVWLRAANVWSTFFLSAFHHHTLHRLGPRQTGPRGPPGPLLLGIGLIWALNLLYSVPAYIYSKRGDKNSTEMLMMVSTTTRPLLGCMWNFPDPYRGLIYSTVSLLIHEILPIVLMSVTNVSTLYKLYGHGRRRLGGNAVEDALGARRIPAERRAAKVIMALIILFTLSWGTSIISNNNINFNGGQSADALRVVARFANSAFIALSPVVLTFGHRRMRAVVKAMLSP